MQHISFILVMMVTLEHTLLHNKGEHVVILCTFCCDSDHMSIKASQITSRQLDCSFNCLFRSSKHKSWHICITGPFWGNILTKMWQWCKKHVHVMAPSFRAVQRWRYLKCETSPDSKVHGANMRPTRVLSAPSGPHVGSMNLAIDVRYPPGEDR